jgi:cobalt-zinc-cadmium efflux system outer membrane protein
MRGFSKTQCSFLLLCGFASWAVYADEFANRSAAPQSLIQQSLPSTRIVEPQAALSIDDAQRLVRTFDPTQSVFDKKRQIADANVEQSGLRANPDLSVTFTGLKQPSPASNAPSNERTVLISQPLDLYGVRRTKVSLAQIKLRSETLLMANYALQLRIAVMAAFNQVMLAEQQFQIATQQQQLEGQMAQVAKKRFDAGKIAEVDLTRLHISQNQAANEQQKAKYVLDQSRQNLTLLWGNANPNFSHTQSSLSLSPLDANVLQKKLIANPANQLSKTLRHEADGQLLLARKQASPIPTVSFGIRQTLDVGRRDNQLILGASIPIPLFSRNQGGIKAAIAAQELVRTKTDFALQQRGYALDRLVTQYNNQALRYQSIRDNQLPQMQTLQQKVLIGFEAGKFSVLDLLQVKRDVLQLQLDAQSSLTDAMSSKLQLEGLLAGLPLDTDLTRPDLLNKIQTDLMNQGLVNAYSLAGVAP